MFHKIFQGIRFSAFYHEFVLIRYFFALDHMSYLRLLPIHLRDLKRHIQRHMQSSFFDRKTERRFSSIAIDEAHEQNNAIVKGDGGAIGPTENPTTLRRWMIVGPEISRLVDEFTTASGIYVKERCFSIH